MRINETDKISYNFLSEEEFIEDFRKGKFIEHRSYDTASGIWYYGLSKDSVNINTNQVVIVDQQGYYRLVEVFGQENVLGIHLIAPERLKIERALSRETRTDKEFFAEFYRRMTDDLNAFNLCQEDDKVFKVENINLCYTLLEIDNILKAKGVI